MRKLLVLCTAFSLLFASAEAQPTAVGINGIPSTAIGAANGVAPLNASGQVGCPYMPIDNSTITCNTSGKLVSSGGSGGASYNPAGQDLSAGDVTATGSPTARTLAARASDVFNPRNYGAYGTGISHSVAATLGVSSLAALASYGSGQYSWVTNPIYGLDFSLASNTAQSAAGTTLAYTAPTGATATTAVAVSYNYAAESNVVLPGMAVSGSCIASGTTVSAVTSGLPFSITTPYASVSGQAKIRLPFVGGLSVGTPVYNSSGSLLGTITAINATTYATSGGLSYDLNQTMMVGSDAAPANGYYSLTGGSASATYLSTGTEAGSPPSGSPQVIAPTVSSNSAGQNYGLLFPAGTLVNAVSGTTLTASKPANISNSNYQQIFAVSPPSITLSANLSAAIAAGSQVFFGGISTVTLSQATSSACGANTTITYAFATGSSGSGSVGALDMDYLGVQSAIIAAAAVGGHVHSPAGTYFSWPHLTIVNANTPYSGGGHITFDGDGRQSTIFKFTTDGPRGLCGLGEYDRDSGGPASAEYANFGMVGPGTYVIGGETALMSGLCVGNGENVEDVVSENFRAGFSVEGNHQKFRKLSTGYNYFGMYLEDNPQTSGAQYIDESEFIADNFAAIGSAWNFGLDSSFLRAVHLGFAPYAFYRAGEPYGLTAGIGNWFSNSTFMNVLPEAVGNGTYYGENGPADKIINNRWIDSSPTLSPDRGYTIPTAGINAVITAGTFQLNVFSNTNLDYSGGQLHDSLAIVSCAVVCGGPSASSFSGSIMSGNIWEDDNSSDQLTTLPGTIYNSTYLAPGFAMQYVSGNVWKTAYAEGCFCTVSYGATFAAGSVMQFNLDNYGSSAGAYASGGIVMGVAGHATQNSTNWPEGGLLAVVTKGLATTNYTNQPSGVGPAYVSTGTGTSVTTTGSSDANTAVRVGVFVGTGGSGQAPVYVRPST